MPEEDTAKSHQDQDPVNCVFWLEKSCPSWEAVPGQAVNKEWYLNVLCQLRGTIQGKWKWPQLWALGYWQLHHNNPPAHASHTMQRFLVKHQITQVTQPPYSPDCAPCNFWLLPNLKPPLKGKRFQAIDEIQENTTGQLMANARTMWGPKLPTLKGTEASLSYVQCFLYLVSC